MKSGEISLLKLSAYPSGLRGLTANEIFAGSNPVADSIQPPARESFTGSKVKVGYVIVVAVKDNRI